MTERVDIGPHTLYLGDCLEVLPTLEGVDAVVTDPPYGVNGGTGGDAKDFGKARYSGAFTDSREYISALCVPVIRACINRACAVSVTPGIRCMWLYPEPRDVGCFWCPAAATHGPWGMATFSPILYYGRDWRAGRGALPSGRVVTEAAEKNGHPCPKPIRPWVWLTEKTSPPNSTVFDPFMGSGTTGVACAQLGRRFVGVEIERRYFDIACERIEAAEAQGQLFAPDEQKPEQEALL